MKLRLKTLLSASATFCLLSSSLMAMPGKREEHKGEDSLTTATSTVLVRQARTEEPLSAGPVVHQTGYAALPQPLMRLIFSALPIVDWFPLGQTCRSYRDALRSLPVDIETIPFPVQSVQVSPGKICRFFVEDRFRSNPRHLMGRPRPVHVDVETLPLPVPYKTFGDLAKAMRKETNIEIFSTHFQNTLSVQYELHCENSPLVEYLRVMREKTRARLHWMIFLSQSGKRNWAAKLGDDELTLIDPETSKFGWDLQPVTICLMDDNGLLVGNEENVRLLRKRCAKILKNLTHSLDKSKSRTGMRPYPYWYAAYALDSISEYCASTCCNGNHSIYDPEHFDNTRFNRSLFQNTFNKISRKGKPFEEEYDLLEGEWTNAWVYSARVYKDPEVPPHERAQATLVLGRMWLKNPTGTIETVLRLKEPVYDDSILEELAKLSRNSKALPEYRALAQECIRRMNIAKKKGVVKKVHSEENINEYLLSIIGRYTPYGRRDTEGVIRYLMQQAQKKGKGATQDCVDRIHKRLLDIGVPDYIREEAKGWIDQLLKTYDKSAPSA